MELLCSFLIGKRSQIGKRSWILPALCPEHFENAPTKKKHRKLFQYVTKHDYVLLKSTCTVDKLSSWFSLIFL